MIVPIILVFIFGYAVGNYCIMERLDEKHPDVASEIREDTRIWWNELLDSYKAKTREQKISELKKEIEALENE